LRLADYRDTHGQFDAIASIEVFEAVGERYWLANFQRLARNRSAWTPCANSSSTIG
jgi:cyclopropane-fatty-acyl-phospholipid synthase